MSKKWLKVALVVTALMAVGACSTQEVVHDNLMQGSIIRINYDKLIVCLGSENGVKPGMHFDVYRTDMTGSMDDGTDQYTRTEVGEIRIESVLGSHYARAQILRGDVQRWDIVELKPESK